LNQTFKPAPKKKSLFDDDDDDGLGLGIRVSTAGGRPMWGRGPGLLNDDDTSAGTGSLLDAGIVGDPQPCKAPKFQTLDPKP
jgi:hypothetical protein